MPNSIGVVELLAQRGRRAGTRDAGVDPTRERDDQQRLAQLGPTLDGKHARSVEPLQRPARGG